MIMATIHDEQTGIRNWFDQTYQRSGFSYLRPLEAYEIYAKLLTLKPQEPFLDVACGPGHMLKQALNYGCLAHGIDISSTAIEMAQSYVPQAATQVANAESLPFATNSMAAVTCLGSLERMIHLDKVLAEIYRVTQPEGRVCFLVRNSETLTWKVLMEKLGMRNKQGHQGANSLVAWRDIFQANGFAVMRVLPDQWPFVRWGQFWTLGLYKPNPTVERHGHLPLNRAYEFIFLLRKQ